MSFRVLMSVATSYFLAGLLLVVVWIWAEQYFFVVAVALVAASSITRRILQRLYKTRGQKSAE